MLLQLAFCGVLVVALLDYVRSLAASPTVSKTQVFRFSEMQFSRADKNHDGELDFEELAAFTRAIAWPGMNSSNRVLFVARGRGSRLLGPVTIGPVGPIFAAGFERDLPDFRTRMEAAITP